MRIAIVTEFFPKSADAEITGGVETRAYVFAKELAKKNKVFVVTSRHKGSKKFEQFDGFTVVRCGPATEYTQTGSALTRAKFLLASYKELLKIKPDIIDGYNYITYVPAMWAGKKLRKAVVATYHDVWVGEWIKNMGLVVGLIGEILERYVLRGRGKHITHFITNSNHTKKELEEYGVASRKVTTVYSGVYKQSKTYKKYTQPTICYVGRLVDYKNVNHLISAVAQARKTIPKLRAIIVGDGPMMQSLKQQTLQLGLQDAIEFTGYKNHDEAMKILSKSHLFSLPSRVEGLGLVTIEAMSCGTPFVSSDIAPTVEATAGGKGGILYPVGQAKKLADGIVTLLTDKKRYNICLNEHKAILKRYDWLSLAKSVENIYTKILRN